MHLQGAKSLIEALSEHERSMPCFDFLAPWVDYHDTFSGYSHSTEVPVKDGLPYIAVPESSSTNRKVTRMRLYSFQMFLQLTYLDRWSLGLLN